jgi:hypothetical protein
MKRQFSALLVLCAALAFGRLAVGKEVVIDFGIVFPTSGTLSFADGIVGTGIQVDYVGAVVGNNAIDPVTVTGGVLNFDSNTGEISIYGGVPEAGIEEPSVLLSGRITQTETYGNVLVVYFVDNKNEALIDYFQMPRPSLDGGGEVEFAFQGTLNLQFSPGEVPTPLSGDLLNCLKIPSPLPLIDFGIIFPTSGTLSMTDGIVGTGIQVDNVGAIIEGLSSIDPVAITGGVLNFDSNTGMITITGGVPDAGIEEGSLLMWGKITDTQNTGSVLVVTFFDYKNQNLIDYFRSPQPPLPGAASSEEYAYRGTLNLQFRPGDLIPLSGDLTNYPCPCLIMNQPPDCSLATLDSTTAWPPNHTFREVQVLGVTDPDGDPVTVAIVGIDQDEAVMDSGLGSGMTCPDGVLIDRDGDGIADAAGLRCEREGRGNGRVYAVHFVASDGRGGECSGSLLYSVPHDMDGDAAVDDGAAFDSTACPGGGSEGQPGILTPEEFLGLTPAPLFLRGDADLNEVQDIGDSVYVLSTLFIGDRPLPCKDAADVNDDGDVDISDPIALLGYLFLGRKNAIREPYLQLGADPSPDLIGCE